MEQTEAPSTINPGDEPPEEYFFFLKRGGEVAQLGQQFTAEDLKTAADQLANLSFADLVQQIDETQQASSHGSAPATVGRTQRPPLWCC